MSVKDIITEMEDRAFESAFMKGICEMYRRTDYAGIELEYKKGISRLRMILTEDQKRALEEMEKAYSERRDYAAQYAFKCGIYGAFRQYFGRSSVMDGGFHDLVVEDLLMQPNMAWHVENFANIEVCNNIESEIMNALNDDDQKYFIDVACALHQRVYSASLDGFYCGYRAAYDIMENADPLVKERCIGKILTVEYHLGYTQPYSKVERLREMAA